MIREFRYWYKTDAQALPDERTQALDKGDVLSDWLYGFYRGAMDEGVSVEPIDLPEQLCRLGQLGVVVDREDVKERLVQIYNECRGEYGFQAKKPLAVPIVPPTDDQFQFVVTEIRHMMDTAL